MSSAGRRASLLLVPLIALAAGLSAQVPDRVRLGIRYDPGSRDGMVVVGPATLDSVRKIVERDLLFSNRFQMAILQDSAGRAPLSQELFKSLGVKWAVELAPAAGGVSFRLIDLLAGQVRQQGTRSVSLAAAGDARLAIHKLSDEIVTWTTTQPGIAASRILFTVSAAIWRIDTDGQNLQQVTRGGGRALSAAWSPDGSKFAYSEIGDYAGAIVIQDLSSGARRKVPTTTDGLNIAPAFSPDGREVAFARTTERGTDIYAVDVERNCCAHRLTTDGNLADNLSPTYSPDGRRIAFSSKRGGNPQIYAMDASGADLRGLVPAPAGSTGASHAPDWSPDGTRLAFHREVGAGFQVMVYELGTGQARAVTSTGRNEDPSWGPDSRHLVFTSSRSGRSQLWILDLETGESRQLETPGRPGLASWSRSLGGVNP